MQINLSEIDTKRLDAVRQEFNAFTGLRYTLERFAAWLLVEALATEEKAAAEAAAEAAAFRAKGLSALKGASRVH